MSDHSSGGRRDRQGGHAQDDRRLAHAHDAGAAVVRRARRASHRRVHPPLAGHGGLRHTQEERRQCHGLCAVGPFVLYLLTLACICLLSMYLLNL